MGFFRDHYERERDHWILGEVQSRHGGNIGFQTELRGQMRFPSCAEDDRCADIAAVFSEEGSYLIPLHTHSLRMLPNVGLAGDHSCDLLAIWAFGGS